MITIKQFIIITIMVMLIMVTIIITTMMIIMIKGILGNENIYRHNAE